MSVAANPESQASESPGALVLHLGQSVCDSGDRRSGVYRICTQDRVTEPLEAVAESLGGGAGSVYPCLYGRHDQLRAIKFLTFNNKETGNPERNTEAFARTFELERRILSQLSHSNISIFHEDGEYVDERGVTWPYLVTDYASGPMLKDALAVPEVDGEAIYQILRSLLEAVVYLHQRGVFHCDIKPDNIRMRAPTRPYDVVLLDWGAVQIFSPPPTSSLITQLAGISPAGAKRRFISTKMYTHPTHQWFRNKLCEPELLLPIIPPHELHTIGKLLQEVANGGNQWSPQVRDKLSDALGSQGVHLLQDMIRDLIDVPNGQGGYRSIEQLVDDFSKLRRDYISPAGIPELGLAAEFHHSVPTATGRAVLTPRLNSLTRHRLVNRLNDVRQLESTYLTFPGATHTRFGHGLATLQNTRYYIGHLLNDSRFRRQATRPDLEATLLLALLHDIGHFQLSHMFEDLATDQSSKTSSEWDKVEFDIPTDDTLFAAMLGVDDDTGLRGGYGEAIHSRARELHDTAVATHAATRGYQSPWEVIVDGFGEDTASTLMLLHRIIYSNERDKPKDASEAQRVLAAVLSSDIDADKTAYLVEDSQRTGVPYGLGVDLDGILGNLCMPTLEDLSTSGHNPAIGIRRPGVEAAQSVMINRSQMLARVYWHYNNRAVTAMVKYVVTRLIAGNELSMKDFLVKAVFESRESCLRYLADQFRRIQRPGESNPIVGVLSSGSAIYGRVCEIGGADYPDFANRLNGILVHCDSSRITDIQNGLREEMCSIMQMSLKEIAEGDILVDIPSKERARPAGEHGGRVFVYDRTQRRGSGKELKDSSPLHSAIKTQHENANHISRVFASPPLAEAIRSDEDLRRRVYGGLACKLREMTE